MEVEKHTKKKKNPFPTRANEPNRQFSKEVEMTNKYMKKC
jgi:hypothetical protein